MTDRRTYALSEPMQLLVDTTASFMEPQGDLAFQRQAYARMARALTPPLPEGVLRDDWLPDSQRPLRLRRYRPAGPEPAAGWPGVIYLHGGGFVMGDPDSHDFITAALCRSLQAAVISVDYRLAPEHPFPAAFQDSVLAWTILQQEAGDLGIDRDRIIVAGDSAGGNLAAALCLFLRDREGSQPRGQILFYPVLSADETLSSHREHANAPLLSKADVDQYWSSYLPDIRARRDPRAAPLAASSFAALPPAFIAVSQWDPLCDEGVLYASRMRDAGGNVHLHMGEGLVHGCLRAAGSCPEVDRLYDDMVSWARRVLA